MEWTLNEDSHFSGGNTGQEIRAQRSQLGSCVATVVVRDDEGIELGRGSGSFSATISPAMAKSSSKESQAAEKLKAAVELAKKKDFDGAITLAEEALKLNPQYSEAQSSITAWKEERARGQQVKTKVTEIADLAKQGGELYRARKYNESIASFNRVLALDPKNADALRQRAMAKREIKDLAGALEDLNRAIEMDPKNALAYLGRGITKERMNDVAGAIADYNRGITLNPGYPNGYLYRGSLKLNQKDNAGAIADLSRVIELEPNNASAYNNRGLAKEHSGDLQGALKDFEKAFALDPKSITSQKNAERVRNKLAGKPSTR